MLVVVAVIGILGALVLPVVSRVREAGALVQARSNAQSIASISSALACAGEAHVLPESLGGAVATAMLLREGVIVSHGALAGRFFSIQRLNDVEIEKAAEYLTIIYDREEVRLAYNPTGHS